MRMFFRAKKTTQAPSTAVESVDGTHKTSQRRGQTEAAAILPQQSRRSLLGTASLGIAAAAGAATLFQQESKVAYADSTSGTYNVKDSAYGAMGDGITDLSPLIVRFILVVEQ